MGSFMSFYRQLGSCYCKSFEQMNLWDVSFFYFLPSIISVLCLSGEGLNIK